MTQTPLDTFIVLCPFVDGINVQEDFINYRHADKYSLGVANKIISENDLQLKAELIGLFKNVLHITENKKL